MTGALEAGFTTGVLDNLNNPDDAITEERVRRSVETQELEDEELAKVNAEKVSQQNDALATDLEKIGVAPPTVTVLDPGLSYEMAKEHTLEKHILSLGLDPDVRTLWLRMRDLLPVTAQQPLVLDALVNMVQDLVNAREKSRPKTTERQAVEERISPLPFNRDAYVLRLRQYLSLKALQDRSVFRPETTCGQIRGFAMELESLLESVE